MKHSRFFSEGREFESKFAAIQHGELLEHPVYMEVRTGDPVRDGVFQYLDGGWEEIGLLPGPRPVPEDYTNPDVPVCVTNCEYRITFDGYDLQRNALRTETAHMVQRERCGWNLKQGTIGGHPLDYAPCTFNQ